jgi:hypothetical protein
LTITYITLCFAGEALTNDFEIPMNTFLKISEELGVPVAENKTVHPTTVLTFLNLNLILKKL